MNGSVPDLRQLLAPLPADSMVPVGWILEHLQEEPPVTVAVDPEPEFPADWTWREKFWRVPGETRLGVAEVCEALGRSKSWVYRLTGPGLKRPKDGRPEEPKPKPPEPDQPKNKIPHRKMDGELVFVVGEIRAWIRAREEVVEGGESYTPPSARKLEIA